MKNFISVFSFLASFNSTRNFFVVVVFLFLFVTQQVAISVIHFWGWPSYFNSHCFFSVWKRKFSLLVRLGHHQTNTNKIGWPWKIFLKNFSFSIMKIDVNETREYVKIYNTNKTNIQMIICLVSLVCKQILLFCFLVLVLGVIIFSLDQKKNMKQKMNFYDCLLSILQSDETNNKMILLLLKNKINDVYLKLSRYESYFLI